MCTDFLSIDSLLEKSITHTYKFGQSGVYVKSWNFDKNKQGIVVDIVYFRCVCIIVNVRLGLCFHDFGELQGFSFIVVDIEDAFCKNTE